MNLLRSEAALKESLATNKTMYSLIDRLALMGYSREEGVDEKSTFCVAGDIISPLLNFAVQVGQVVVKIIQLKKFI